MWAHENNFHFDIPALQLILHRQLDYNTETDLNRLSTAHLMLPASFFKHTVHYSFICFSLVFLQLLMTLPQSHHRSEKLFLFYPFVVKETDMDVMNGAISKSAEDIPKLTVNICYFSFFYLSPLTPNCVPNKKY